MTIKIILEKKKIMKITKNHLLKKFKWMNKIKIK